MNIDTKRRVLTLAGAALGIVLGGVITAQRFRKEPLWYKDEVLAAPAKPVEAVTRMASRTILVNRNGATMWFGVKGVEQCDSGDIDYIRQDLKRAGAQSILVTVEPLFGSAGEPVLTRYYTPDEFARGVEFNSTVPFEFDPRHFGLFFCSDSAGTKSCQGKPLHDPESEDEELGPNDRVYFFSYMLLRGDKLTVLDDALFRSRGEQLESYLLNAEELPQAEVQSIVDIVSTLNKPSHLRWARVDASDARIRVTLPMRSNDPKCTGTYVHEIRGELGFGRVLYRSPDGTIQNVSEANKEKAAAGGEAGAQASGGTAQLVGGISVDGIEPPEVDNAPDIAAELRP